MELTDNIFTNISDIADDTPSIINDKGGDGKNETQPIQDSLFGDLIEPATQSGTQGSSGAFDIDALLNKFNIAEKPKDIDSAIAAIEAKMEAKYLAMNNDEAKELTDLLSGSVEDRVEAYVRSNAKVMMLTSEQDVLDKIDEILESDRDTDKYDQAITKRINDRLAEIKSESEQAAKKRAEDEIAVKKDFEEKLSNYKMLNNKTGKEEVLPTTVQQMIREYFWGEGFIDDIRKDPIGFVMKTHPKLSTYWEKNIENRAYQQGVKQAISGLEETEIKVGKGGGTISTGSIATAATVTDII